MSDNQFLAAAAAVNITPDLHAYPIHLHGYGARGSSTAAGVHDPLYGKILVMQRGENIVVIVTMDILQIDGLLLDAIVERVALPGISQESLIVCASHTHSAPAALQKRTRNLPPRLNWYESNYYEYCVEALARGVREAVANLQPARYGKSKAKLGNLVRNRRVPSYDYDTRAFCGPVEEGIAVDDELITMQFINDSGDVIATLVNLAAHGTVLGADNLLVSADWAGYMQHSVENHCGGICLYSNGAEGNLAPDCGAGQLGFAEAETFGLTIGTKVIELTGSLTFQDPDQLTSYSKIVELPDYQVPEESPFLQAGLSREFVENFVRTSYPEKIRQTLVRLDDIVMLTIPGEMFTELSLDFKARARDMGVAVPMILGLANDSIGYMLSTDQYAVEGYETGMCVYGPGLGVGLVNEGLLSLRRLFLMP